MELDKSDIWDSFSKGDEKSLQSIYDDHYKMLVNYGYKFTPDLILIEEAIQSLFIKLWKNRSNLNMPVSLKHYLLKAFRHTLLAQLQSESRWTARFRSFEQLPFHFEPSPDTIIISREETDEQRLVLKNRMQHLTNRQREAIYLRFYQELSYEEVATLLNMNISGTYKLIYRAIERLRVTK